jgi:AcrR family transcriptional regulator
MTSQLPEIARPSLGLRERKKARTRATIRTEAIRLFAEHGFAPTTVEQIAEAADISPSTFFRYFPTKEAVVVTDDYDPLIFEAYRAQPPELSPIQAFRNAVRQVLGAVSPAEKEQEQLRFDLLRTVPELRTAMLEQYVVGVVDLAELIAERVGKPADDFAVRTLAGAVMGVALSVTHDLAGGLKSDPKGGNEVGGSAQEVEGMEMLIDRMDAALALLDAGLPL